MGVEPHTAALYLTAHSCSVSARYYWYPIAAAGTGLAGEQIVEELPWHLVDVAGIGLAGD